MPIELLFAAGVPSPFHLSLPCALSVNCCLHKTSLSGGGPPGELLVGSGSLAFLCAHLSFEVPYTTFLPIGKGYIDWNVPFVK